MGKVSQETLDEIRSIRKLQAARRRSHSVAPKPVPIPDPVPYPVARQPLPRWAKAGRGLPIPREAFEESLVDIPDPVSEPSAALRYLERAGRLAGLGIGTAVAANPFTAHLHFVPGVKDWLPDVERVPEAMKAFNRMRQQGDWDAAIEAYHDVLDAGPGFWGAAEVAGSFIPTGGPALGGAKLISAAPKLAGTLARIAPVTPRTAVQVRRGLQPVIRGTGKVLRAPWEAEEAAGRLAFKGLGWIANKTVAGPESKIRGMINAVRQSGGREVDPAVLPRDIEAKPLADINQDLGVKPNERVITFVSQENPTGATWIIRDNNATRRALDRLDYENVIAIDGPLHPKKAMEHWRYSHKGPLPARVERQAASIQQQAELSDIGYRINQLENQLDGLKRPRGQDSKAKRIRQREYDRSVKRLRREIDMLTTRRTNLEARPVALEPAPLAEELLEVFPQTATEPFDPAQVFRGARPWEEAATAARVAPDVPVTTTAAPVTRAVREAAGGPEVQLQPGQTRQREFSLDDIIPDEQADDYIKASGPSGGDPPASGPPVGISSAADDIFEEIRRVATPGETPSVTLLRRHEGAMNVSQNEASRLVRDGEKAFHALGLSVSREGREIIKESAIPEIDALFRALHNEGPVPAHLRGVYDNLRTLTDWEQASRIDFDPDMATVKDYFFRGWKPPDELIKAFQQQGGMGWPPGFKKPRNNATYREMRELGFEPLNWNPFEQWRISRMQGIRHRQQMMLLERMKKSGIAQTSGGKPYVKGWRVPEVGPAFEGKPMAYIDEVTGEAVPYMSSSWAVPDDVARRLENIYGKTPSLGKIGIRGREIDLMKVIDAIVFIPKRAKLFLSFFQQQDFLTRSLIGTWTQVADQLIAGKPIGAVKALAKWPESALSLLRANLSPDYRQLLKKQLTSTDELIPGRPGIHLKGMMEAGLSIRDVTIFPTGVGDIARSAAEEGGLLGVKRVMRLVSQVESASRRGLFDGVYPAAQIADIKNNMVHVLVRRFPNATDEAINGMVARMINIKYSTVPASQSMFQNQTVRAFLQRVFFSIGESEGLLRQGVQAISGPYANIWRKHWLGAYLALLSTANVIHFVSTGKPLPADRYVPISKDNWGLLPFGYNRDFSAPTIPLRGRGGTQLTVDIVGQMDTVLRLTNPAQFISSRESVPVRAVVNQLKGTDFFGAPIDEVGPGGIFSRTAALAVDMFAPIGFGQSAVGIARETIPAIGRLLPPGEETLGIGGQLLQTPGLNIRGETTPQLRDRVARESGYTIQDDPNRMGEPARTWDDLTRDQKMRAEREHPTLSQELALRTSLQARRGSEYAVGKVKVDKANASFIDDTQKITTSYLSMGPNGKGHMPPSARTAYEKAQAELRVKKYGSWDKEKQRYADGYYDQMYDMDKEQEEPDPSRTLDHALWRWHNLIPSVTDENGEIDWEEYNKASSEFWASLQTEPPQPGQPSELDLMLDNIRIMEGDMSEEMQTFLDAGRYAQSVRVNIDGQSVSFWDIDDLPEVRDTIARDAGATRAQVEKYMDTQFSSRDYLEGDIYKKIGSALSKARRTDTGVLGTKKWEFMNTAPGEWLMAMIAAGYSMPRRGSIITELKKSGIYSTITEQPYARLYRDALARR